ncbi:unnamed protein product, partial [Rotaria sp. Silwood1]
MQQQTTATYGNNNEQPRQLNISNEALTYAVENNLSTLKIECIPLLENCEHAKKFPEPIKRLSPHNTVVIKFVPNEIHKDEITDELKNLYSSICTVEDMIDLLTRLKHDRNKLPPNIKLFIPVDCRTNVDRDRFLISRNVSE